MNNDQDTSATPADSAAQPNTSPQKNHQKIGLIAGAALFLVAAITFGVFALFGADNETATDNNQVDDQSQQESVAQLGAALTLVEGLVQTSPDKEAGAWTDAEGGESVLAGHSVRTLTDSRAVVLLDDGSAIRLDANTEITLRESTETNVDVLLVQGSAYSRVIASDSRQYSVSTDSEGYQAQGTAYTVSTNTVGEKLEVYHSQVKLKEKGDVVSAGEKYDLKTQIKDSIDVAALTNDEFAQWNKERDIQNDSFKDQLGFLAETPKEEPVPTQPDPAPVTPPTTATASISLSGQSVDGGIRLSWSLANVSSTDGFKIVRSKTSATPIYGVDKSVYVGSAGTRSYTLDLKDGKSYYFRVCIYSSAGTCSTYSNSVQITAPNNPPESVQGGAVNLTSSGQDLSWTFSGTAPHGFKVVMSADSSSPTYPSNSIQYISPGTTSTQLPAKSAGTYYVRVCKYTASDVDGGCTDYSNTITYTVD